jgi:transcriptional regulator with XRE-family HTH domain
MAVVDAARVLRYARRRAALTQRQLAARAGVAQPTIARIESGVMVPRVDTLDRLLEACGMGLEVEPRLGVGEDRTLPRELLKHDAAVRAASAAASTNNVEALLARARIRPRPRTR